MEISLSLLAFHRRLRSAEHVLDSLCKLCGPALAAKGAGRAPGTAQCEVSLSSAERVQLDLLAPSRGPRSLHRLQPGGVRSRHGMSFTLVHSSMPDLWSGSMLTACERRCRQESEAAVRVSLAPRMLRERFH